VISKVIVKNAVWDVMLCGSLRTDIPPKHWFLQEPHGITSQKTAFFIVTTMKTPNLTKVTGLEVGKIYEHKAKRVQQELHVTGFWGEKVIFSFKRKYLGKNNNSYNSLYILLFSDLAADHEANA
jgi:hypothetical protein